MDMTSWAEKGRLVIRYPRLDFRGGSKKKLGLPTAHCTVGPDLKISWALYSVPLPTVLLYKKRICIFYSDLL